MDSKDNTLFKIEIDQPASLEYGEASATQEIEVELLPPINLSDPRAVEIYNSIADIDQRLSVVSDNIEKLNTEIDSLTNHADGLDYAVAVASGVIAGLLDSFFVGETEIDMKKIQDELAKKYHVANDNAFKHKTDSGPNVSNPLYHRLDDLAHHPTPLGLVASILVRYFRLVIFVDGTDGKPHIFFADASENPAVRKLETEQLIKAWIGAILSGLFMWLANVAEKQYEEKYNEEMPEALRKIVKALGKTPLIIEVLKTADTWLGHIMSDVSTPQGVPGILLSLLKEISVLPVIRNTDLPVVVDKLYRKGEHNLAEWGGVVFTAAKKQAMPVLINEALVRGFYFVRRLIVEFKEHRNIKDINWQKVIPIGNRTVERMMTIASGTFVAFDIADAAIRSGGFNPTCILRINFVGIGRFAIAIGTDVVMGVKKAKKENLRINLTNEQLHLMNAKIFYKEADMWIKAEDAGKSIAEALEIIGPSFQFTISAWSETHKDMDKIKEIMKNKREEEALLNAFLEMYSDSDM